MTEIEAINPENLLYLDETGIDSNLHREYGRAKRGNQVKSDIYGKKGVRTSVIAGWFSKAKEMVAPYVFEGYTDAKRFNGWIEECLLPCLKTGQVVVMDNASFHKNKKTKELIESVGCKLIYQPAYSQDLNPIEKQRAILKRKYRTFKHQGYKHQEAIDRAFAVC